LEAQPAAFTDSVNRNGFVSGMSCIVNSIVFLGVLCGFLFLFFLDHRGHKAFGTPIRQQPMIHYNARLGSMAQSDSITELLKNAKTIAVVGLSDSPLRPSHGVSAYMQSHGYRIIPVNPNIKEALGETAYASLLDVPDKIDIVNIFRRPQFVGEVVDQAIQLRIPAIWMQEEVINQPAAEKARQHKILVIMDRCILKEHRARLG